MSTSGENIPPVKKSKRISWPHISIDLRDARQRRKAFWGLLIFVIVGSAFLIASVEGYHYTESAEFCGEVCHPMGPEIIRYELSEHANVDCVKCHIGPGTSFFVKSKIDGIKQVYAVLTDNFSRPITSPVHDLRPARDTCETCHAPTSYKDNIIKTIRRYENNEDNTPVQSTLILKMGGWQHNTGISQGIHWHISNEIYYIAADEQRQVILWVGVKQPDGRMKEFFARDMLTMAQSEFVEEAMKNEEMRLMDCIDCHNRAAHYIPSPQEVVDEAIDNGLISRDIPFIRAKAVEVLTPAYTSKMAAYETIEGLADFYGVNFAVGGGHADTDELDIREINPSLGDAIAQIKFLYDTTNFPEMNLNWETNPNNERHTPTLGCFRCHDGKHINIDSDEPEEISVKCNLCHTVPIVGRGDELLIESPVIVGNVPPSHEDFSWTLEHRDIDDAESEGCYLCHGQGFCNNGICHNLDHPTDMLYTHAEEYYETGDQVCYTCHQNILCSRCHPGGIVDTP